MALQERLNRQHLIGLQVLKFVVAFLQRLKLD